MLADEIAALIIPGSGSEFSGVDIRLFGSPCVYIFMREEVALYIGMSRSGIGRVFQNQHRKAKSSMLECTKLLVYFCKNASAAAECERLLISSLKPRYNGRGSYYHVAKLLGINRAKRYNQAT